MKKLSTFLIGLTFISSAVFGQALIDEDFESATFPPTDWVTYDEDGLTSSSTQFNGNWERANLTADGTFQAVSGNEYTTAGTSDDWLVTPQVTIPDVAGEATILSFVYAVLISQTRNNAAILEVKVSTTGNAVADFTDTYNIAANTAAGTFQFRSVDLSSYAGQSIYIAFRDVTANSVAMVLDNVSVESLPDNGISLSELTFRDYGADRDQVRITGVVRNTGATTITSFDLNWTEGGVDNTTTVTSGVNILPFSSATFSHPRAFVVSGAGSKTNISVEVSNPNGQTDPDLTDNTLSSDFAIQYGVGTAKNALLEEFTTAPCGFCPDGAIFVEDALSRNSDVIAIGVHACFGSDAMTIPEAEELCSEFSGGAPTAMVDRVKFEGEAQVGMSRGNDNWGTRSGARAALVAPVSVDINGDFNSTSKVANIKISTSFVDFFPGDIRVSLAIVEDSVTGTGSGYDQRNYYSDGSRGPHPTLVGAGDPLVGYVHRHVLRDMLPNTWGDVATWNADFTQRTLNQAHTTDFNFTLDNTWDESKVSVVAIVARYGGNDDSKYEILNSEQVKLSELIAVGIDENKELGDDLKIYPNPSTNVTNLKLRLQESNDVEVTLFDITGKQLRYQDYGKVVAGPQIFKIDVADLANGFYFVNLRIGDETITRKISVNK